MNSLALKVRRFLKSEDGPTAVEYAVMLALIIVICLTVIGNLGSNVANTFKNVDSKMDSAGVATATPLT